MVQTEERVLAMTLDRVEALGLLVNYPKYQLVPTQSIDFLGFKVDANTVSQSLPDAKPLTYAKRLREFKGSNEYLQGCWHS